MMRVLVLCTGNVARSQMAAAFLRQLLGGRAEVFSAGSDPEASLWEPVVEAMAELGIDISSERPKSVREFDGVAFDWVITVCDSSRESCPIPPRSKNTLHQPFSDPRALAAGVDDPRRVVRAVRDQIREWAESFVASLEG
jgi:arsenate reductase